MRVRLPFPKVPRTAAANDECTDNAYKLAIKYKIKTAGGTDALFDEKLAEREGIKLAKMTRWCTPARRF